MNRLSKNKFLSHFPQCVFCGGRSASVERDHQPGRNLFDQRIWPEGYEFPTCKPCNRATKNDELLVDLFARFPSCLASREAMQDWNRRFVRLLEQFPDLYWAMRMTNNSRRVIQRTHPDKGGAVINFPEEFRYRFNRVAFKLGAALHWKHTDHQIIPPDGGCMIDIVPNEDPEVNCQADEFLRTLADQRAMPVANRRSLSDQFEYDFWSREGNAGLYSVRIRKHFRFIIAVCLTPSDYEAFASIPEISRKMIQPFSPEEVILPQYHQHRLEGMYRWRVLREIG